MTFNLKVACNADDRHWEDTSCYRTVAQYTVDNVNDPREARKIACRMFRVKYPSIMQLIRLGGDARVAVTMEGR